MQEVYFLDNTLKFSSDLNSVNSKHKLWIDITNPSKEDLNKIKEAFKLHSQIIEDCKLTASRPKTEQIENNTLIIAYELTLENPREICFILGKNYLISVHKEKLEYFEKLKQDKEKLKECLELGIDFILHELLSKTISNYFNILENLEDDLDELENKALKDPKPEVLEKLFKIKRKLLKTKKIIYPQREAINILSMNQNISKDSRFYFRDVYEDMLIITDMVEDFRETISSILEVHLSVTSNRLNEIMKVLTIISTIFIPMTLVASIYGMNFKYIPEIGWKYGYAWALGLMALIFIIMLFYLKRKKWL